MCFFLYRTNSAPAPPPPPPPPPSTFFKTINQNDITKPTSSNKNAVWDRGKTLAKSPEHDINYLKRLESNLELYLDSLPAVNNNMPPSSPPSSLDDILVDVDIDSFEKNPPSKVDDAEIAELRNNKSNNFISDYVDTASLSNFHNVRDVLLNIQRRLETYLTSNEKGASSKLEVNIEEFLHELDRYVSVINEKKEKELKRFSENMSNHTTIIHMKNAFQKKGGTVGDDHQIYEDALESDVVSYYSNDSISDLRRCGNREGFIMRNCYDRCSLNSSGSFDSNSVEYYSMLINEERSENLLNDAPPPLPPILPRYHDRDKISLVFQNPDQVIRQWQKYQLNTITIKPKKSKFLNFSKGRKKKKGTPYDIWSFTLDYHKTKMLQLKLEKEKKIRLVLRVFFCFFILLCFVLVVYLVQSFFQNKSRT